MQLSAPIFQLKRQAKQLSRDHGIPLHAALDRIARQEGFSSWSLLAAHIPRVSSDHSASALLGQLCPGDLVLLGARPGHGKTMMGLELIAEAIKAGRQGVFFTLEFNEQEARDRFHSIAGRINPDFEDIQIDASDAISADYVMDRLRASPRGTIVVIDYLQIMDQRRSEPDLSKQVSVLKAFAAQSGVIIVFISQIDRIYEFSEKPIPELTDVRLPNPLDLALFDKACFLNNGRTRIDTLN
jgi:replicative DNA helicase